MRRVEFVETPTFTRLIGKLMDDDEYAKLQLALALRPDWGKVIRGGGGLRKLRWAGSGVASAAGFGSFITGRLLTTSFGCWWPIQRASATIYRMMKSSN